MSKYIVPVKFLDSFVPQVKDFEDLFNSQVSNLGSLDDENISATANIHRKNLKDGTFEARKLKCDYYFAEQTASVLLTTSAQVMTGTTITFSVDARSLAFAFLTIVSPPMLRAGGVDNFLIATVDLDGSLGTPIVDFSESDTAAAGTISTITGLTDLSAFAAGTHTLRISAYLNSPTSGSYTVVNSRLDIIVYGATV